MTSCCLCEKEFELHNGKHITSLGGRPCLDLKYHFRGFVVQATGNANARGHVEVVILGDGRTIFADVSELWLVNDYASIPELEPRDLNPPTPE